jgi:class 3 adenylate cyclase
MEPPETKYTKLGDSYIAYQVVGEAPIDHIYVTGIASHIDIQWEFPPIYRFVDRLTSFCRLIYFDRRGTGISDPVPLDALPTWEDWTEDARAVLDAVGSERTAITASLDAGPMGLLFAATYPERVSALILLNTSARLLAAPDYPIGLSPEQAEALATAITEGWGTEAITSFVAPSQAHDPQVRRIAAKFLRGAATPRAVAAQLRYLWGLDARAVLPLIRVPTLVLHSRDLALFPMAHGRYLAEHIPGAKFEELPGGDPNPTTDPEAMGVATDLFEEFLTGQRRAPQADRVLATVLFTDIVGSTERTAELGDRRWKELLDRVDRVASGEIEKFGGRLVKTTGDGHLATFDGPGKAVRCARGLIEAVEPLGIQLRAGLHTGEVELRGPDVGGIAVHIGARVSSLARPSEVLVSRTVTDLVAGSGLEFDDRGEHSLKGIGGEWRLFSVRG